MALGPAGAQPRAEDHPGDGGSDTVKHIYNLHCPGLLQRGHLRGLAGGAAGGGDGQRGGGDSGGADLGPRLVPRPARGVDQDEQLRGETWHLSTDVFMWIVLCWQEVVRVPLIVVAPGVPGGQVLPCCNINYTL